MSASFSPDGKRIVTCGRDRTVKIWDSVTGMDLLSLQSTVDTQMYAAFNPNGKTLVTSGLDGRIRLWDPEAPR